MFGNEFMNTYPSGYTEICSHQRHQHHFHNDDYRVGGVGHKHLISQLCHFDGL